MIPNLYIENGCFTKHPYKWLFGVPGTIHWAFGWFCSFPTFQLACKGGRFRSRRGAEGKTMDFEKKNVKQQSMKMSFEMAERFRFGHIKCWEKMVAFGDFFSCFLVVVTGGVLWQNFFSDVFYTGKLKSQVILMTGTQPTATQLEWVDSRPRFLLWFSHRQLRNEIFDLPMHAPSNAFSWKGQWRKPKEKPWLRIWIQFFAYANRDFWHKHKYLQTQSWQYHSKYTAMKAEAKSKRPITVVSFQPCISWMGGEYHNMKKTRPWGQLAIFWQLAASLLLDLTLEHPHFFSANLPVFLAKVPSRSSRISEPKSIYFS